MIIIIVIERMNQVLRNCTRNQRLFFSEQRMYDLTFANHLLKLISLLIKDTCLAPVKVDWRKLLSILRLTDLAAKRAKYKVSSRDEDKEGE